MAVRAGSPVWQELLGSENGPLSDRQVVGGAQADWAANEAGRP